MNEKLKLTVELVPKPLWGVNARSAMGQTNWDKVRNETYAKYNHQCGICGAEGRLEAHEIWQYDDKKLVQRLAGIVALCPMCHSVKHLGRTEILASEGKVDLERVIAHFEAVNGCSRKDFNAHRKAEATLWAERSANKNWTLDWGEFQRYVKSRP